MYDVIIVGTGIAGLSAGMYSARFNMKTLVLGSQPGGLITTTHLVENYPGIVSISGPDMANVFLEHARKTGAEMKYETVKSVVKEDGGFRVATGSGEYQSKTVILCLGTEYRKIGVPGEKEFANKGVSYCAFCDAAFYRDKVVAVVGGGDTAAEEAGVLANQVKEVHVFVRGEAFKGSEPRLVDDLLKNPKIKPHYKTEIAEIRGGDKVTGVLLKSGEEMALDGVFVAIGHIPNSALAKDLGVALNDYGYIKTTREAETNVPGVFAAGDVCDNIFKQAIIGAAEAVYASYGAYKYLRMH